MKKTLVLQFALLWAVLAMFCWGSYGPNLGKATALFGGSKALSLAMIGVGYGVFGLVLGLILRAIGAVKDKGEWNRDGFTKGFAAGALGVGGNLSLILALFFYHHPLVVMPLVFGGVQFGNTITTSIAMKSLPKKLFYAGVFLLVIGVVGALITKPSGSHGEVEMNWLFLPCVAGVWVCWGIYGTAVHASIFAFKKSGLRAMVAISVAYVVLATCGGLLVFAMGLEPDAHFTMEGFYKGLFAGFLATAGAWGVTFANRYVKGGPSVVMPLVFAGAPVINSFYSMWSNSIPLSSVNLLFWMFLFVIIVGGYVVLTNKPDDPHHAVAPTPVQ